jgi:hypothetical protein
MLITDVSDEMKRSFLIVFHYVMHAKKIFIIIANNYDIVYKQKIN